MDSSEIPEEISSATHFSREILEPMGIPTGIPLEVLQDFCEYFFKNSATSFFLENFTNSSKYLFDFSFKM